MSDVNNVLECKEVGGSVEESCAHSVAGCSFFFLQETRCEEPKEGFQVGSGSMGWVGKAAEGASGGL